MKREEVMNKYLAEIPISELEKRKWKMHSDFEIVFKSDFEIVYNENLRCRCIYSFGINIQSAFILLIFFLPSTQILTIILTGFCFFSLPIIDEIFMHQNF